jgi:hypothetical protein
LTLKHQIWTIGFLLIQVEHQAFSSLLGLNNPFNTLDVDFNNESDFYDWLAKSLSIHLQIVASLGL